MKINQNKIAQSAFSHVPEPSASCAQQWSNTNMKKHEMKHCTTKISKMNANIAKKGVNVRRQFWVLDFELWFWHVDCALILTLILTLRLFHFILGLWSSEAGRLTGTKLMIDLLWKVVNFKTVVFLHKINSLLEPSGVAFHQSIVPATNVSQVMFLPSTNMVLFQVLCLPPTWPKSCSKYCACHQHEPSPCSCPVLLLPAANM